MMPKISLAILLFCCGGCLQRLAIDQTAALLVAGSSAVNEETDYEYAAAAVPPGIVTIEGLWRSAQDSELLTQQLAQNYASYAFAFIEDQAEEAAARGDDEEAQHQYRRARRFYMRGRRYGLYLLEMNHEGFKAKMRRPLAEFERYLHDEMDEDDVPALFWTAYGWASAINVSRDDIGMIADLPTALAMVERCRELDPTFFGHGPVLFMANVYAGFPAALGGNPEKGRELYEQVIRLHQGKDLLPLYMLAQTYAIQTQNRQLFERLLNKVIDSPDREPKYRLTNAIARRRARRLLARVNELFFD